MFKKRELPEYLRVPWSIRDVLLFIVAWFGLQVGLGIALTLLAYRVPAVANFMAGVKSGDFGASFTLNLIGVILGLVLVAVIVRHYHASWATLGWRRVGIGRTIGYLIGILVVFLVLAQAALMLVKLLVPQFDANQPQTNEITQAVGSHRSLALVALVLLPPIFEETIFRGFIFPALAKRIGVMGGAIISSMVFGIAHGQVNLFIYTTILGLLLCFMYVRLRSIVPGILLHMLNNYLAFLALSGK